VREKEWPRVNCWIRLILAILMVVAVFVLFARLGGIESTATNDDLLVLLAVLVVFHLPALLRSTTLFFSFRRKSAEDIRHQRASLWHVSYNMLAHLPLAFVLLISFGRLWSFDSIGFSSRFHWVWGTAVGVGWAIVFMIILAYLYRFASRHTKDSPDSSDAVLIRMNLPRGRTAQMLQFFETVFFCPTFEEFIYRGFFVYLVGNVVGSAVAGIFIGLLFCIWLNLYMGPSKLLSVVSFFVASIVLLYSPFGLLSVIAFHATCNTRYMIHLQLRSARYLAFVRDSRQSRTSPTPGPVLQSGNVYSNGD